MNNYPDEIDYRWLAGFFDGDGSLGIYYRKPRKDHLNGEYFIRAQITQNNEPFMKWLANKTNANIHYQNGENHETTWGNSYIVYWTHAKAEIFLQLIAPYIVLKKKELDLIFEFRSKQRKVGEFGAKPEYFKELERIRQQLRKLKKERNGERI